MTCTHEWIITTEFNVLLNDDVELTQCAQCGTYQAPDGAEFDDTDYDYDDDNWTGV